MEAKGLLWGPFFEGPVQPNMLNMPKSATVHHPKTWDPKTAVFWKFYDDI